MSGDHKDHNSICSVCVDSRYYLCHLGC